MFHLPHCDCLGPQLLENSHLDPNYGLTVLCPTYGRPEAADQVWRSFLATKTQDSTRLWFLACL